MMPGSTLATDIHWIWLVAFPLVGALIGWGTNLLAVRMLFRPYRAINLFGLRIQGLLPKRRTEVARRIAETVQDELLSTEEIARIFESFDMREEVETALDDLVRERLRPRIAQKAPMLGPMMDTLLPKIQPVIVEELTEHAMQMRDRMVERIHLEIDIAEIVVEKLEDYDLAEFEAMVMRVARSELRHIEVLGALIGGTIGLLQSLVLIYI